MKRIGDRVTGCEIEPDMVLLSTKRGYSKNLNVVAYDFKIEEDILHYTLYDIQDDEEYEWSFPVRDFGDIGIDGNEWTLIDRLEPCSLSEQAPVERKRHLIERRG